MVTREAQEEERGVAWRFVHCSVRGHIQDTEKCKKRKVDV